MSTVDDLLAQIAALKANGASQKVSLDAIKAGIGIIVAGLPKAGGLSADDTAKVRAALVDLKTDSDANTQEASDDAAAVNAGIPAQPADPADPASPDPAPDPLPDQAGS